MADDTYQADETQDFDDWGHLPADDLDDANSGGTGTEYEVGHW